jgi:phosphatidate cytidylyltransferase
MTDRDDSRKPDSERPPSTTEQLRIIGAEEAGSLVARRPANDEPASADQTDDQWAPPAEAPRSIGRRPVFESIPDAPRGFDDDWLPGVLSSPRRPEPEPLDPSDLSQIPDSDDVTVLGPAPSGTTTAAAQPAPAADEDGSAELELPHWTAPPTGQVPRALVDESRRNDDSWSTYASSPRWRDASSDWEADDFSDVAELGEDFPRTGALADRERPAIDEFFAFDELDDEPAPRPSRGGRGSRRVAIDRLGTGEQRAVPGPDVGAPPGGGRAPVGGRNIPVASALGVGLAALAIALFRIGPGPSMVLVAALLALGAAEFFDTARKGGYHPATLLGLAAAVGLPAAAYWRGPDAFPLVMGLAVVFGLLWFLFGVDKDNATANLGVTLLGVGYIGGLGAFAALVLRAPGVDSTAILLCGVVPTVAHDVLGYVVGRNAGRSLLSPTVSPSKTVEGLLGGCIGAVIASVAFNDLIFSSPFDGLANSLLLGLVVAVLAPLGDLSESLIKRDLGVKDMGTALPGHGGVLDRFDAMLFVLPGLYYLAMLRDILPA